MANTMYPTGVATTPIDFSGAANAFMQSALQTKLQEINQRKEQLTESGKAVAHFMSLEALPELAEGIRETFKGEIQGFRDKITNRFKETNGALTYDDKLMIEREYNRIAKDMEAKKIEADQWGWMQQQAMNPAFTKSVDPNAVLEAAENFKLFKEGKPHKTVNEIIASNIRVPHDAEVILGRNPIVAKKFDEYSNVIEEEVDQKTGIVTYVVTNEEAYDAIEPLIRDEMRTMAKYKDMPEEQFNVEKDKIIKLAQKKTTSVERQRMYTGRTGSSGSGSGGIGKLTEITPRVEILPNTNKSIAGYMEYPDSQTTQNIAPTRMVNMATGKTEEVSSVKDGIKLVGLSFDEGKAYFQAEGGVMQKDGETVFGVKGRMPVKATDMGAYTESEVRARAVEIANANIPPSIPSKDRKVGNPVVEKTENGYIIRFPVTYKKKPEGAGVFASRKEYTEEVTIELNPVMGKEGATWYSTDLYTTGSNIMGATVKKYQTGGRSWEELLRVGRGGKTTVTPSTKKVESDPLGLGL